MKIQIVKNKYLNALLLLMIFSAVAHMLILFFVALKTSDIYVLNYFNILDLDILFPVIFKDGALGNLASLIFAASLYIIIFQWTEKKF